MTWTLVVTRLRAYLNIFNSFTTGSKSVGFSKKQDLISRSIHKQMRSQGVPYSSISLYVLIIIIDCYNMLSSWDQLSTLAWGQWVVPNISQPTLPHILYNPLININYQLNFARFTQQKFPGFICQTKNFSALCLFRIWFAWFCLMNQLYIRFDIFCSECILDNLEWLLENIKHFNTFRDFLSIYEVLANYCWQSKIYSMHWPTWMAVLCVTKTYFKPNVKLVSLHHLTWVKVNKSY